MKTKVTNIKDLVKELKKLPKSLTIIFDETKEQTEREKVDWDLITKQVDEDIAKEVKEFINVVYYGYL